MRRWLGLSTWEWGSGVVILLAAAGFVVPRAEHLMHRSRRAEVPWVVGQLRDHALQHNQEHGRPFLLPPGPQAPAALGTHRVRWQPDLAWTPPVRSVRGTYRSEVVDGVWTLFGECDVDGDGVRALYTATLDQPVRRVTPDDVY